MLTKQQIQQRAEATFKVRQVQVADAPLAKMEYERAQLAVNEKTARLRSLRMAKNKSKA